MNDVLLNLPANVRERLIAALEAGDLALTTPPPLLRAALNWREDVNSLAEALRELHALGMSPRGAAAALRGVACVSDRQRKPDLVLSGLQLNGIFARDTRKVYDELLGSAERSVWLSSFVYHNGPKVFQVLARRMQARPELAVNLLLNIQREWNDSTKSEQLVNEFARSFWNKERGWPGARRPRVYYDPRSLELPEPGRAGAGGRAVLHAKAVVVDDEALFITSANLTEAAGERNIEMGVLQRDRGMALTVITYFQSLIDGGHLLPLPEWS